MIHLKRSALAVPIFLLAGLIGGCTTTSGQTSVEDEGTQQAAADTADTVKQVPNASHAFGPEQMLRDALTGANLSADQQKTIDTALGSAFTRKDDGGGAMKPFFATLATQVKSGTIDEAALNAQLDTLGKTSGDHRAAMVSAMQTVHDTLNADQRAAVASSIEAKMAAFGQGEQGEKRDGEKHEGGKHGGFGKLGFLLHGIDVTDAQRERIKDALHATFGEQDREGFAEKREEMKTKMTAAIEAFKSDKFDASTALPMREEEGREHLGKLVKAMTVIVPLLDDKQRAALADKLQNPPSMKMQHPAAEGAPSE